MPVGGSLLRRAVLLRVLALSATHGVGHPVKPLSDLRRARARSAQIGGPDCISQSFQVSTYSGEPFTSKRARNLLAKSDCSFAEGDEVAEDRPQVPFIFFGEAFAGVREGLARAGAGAHGAIFGPSCETEGERPSADAGEEVVLCIASEIMRRDFGDAAFVHVPGRDFASADEFAQPGGGFRVVFVVVVHKSERAPANHAPEPTSLLAIKTAHLHLTLVPL
jgi:hypothetical protein